MKGAAILGSENGKGAEANGRGQVGSNRADWTVINKVMRACEAGGFNVFWDEIDRLVDPVLQIRVAKAFFPDLIREALKDEMAEQGITHEDLKEFLTRRPAGYQ
jgi:hypothetical protein